MKERPISMCQELFVQFSKGTNIPGKPKKISRLEKENGIPLKFANVSCVCVQS